MPNPNGNPGNKGGGRASAYREAEMAEKVKDLFLGKVKLADVEKQIESGTFNAWDMTCKKILKDGNDRLISELLRKLVPDLVDLTSGGQSVLLDETPETRRLAAEYEAKLREAIINKDD